MLTFTLPLIVLLLASFSNNNCQGADTCVLKTNDKTLNKAQPLLLRIAKIGGQIYGLYIPDSDGNVALPVNTDVRLACVGEANPAKRLPRNSFENVKPAGQVQNAAATCTYDKVFQIWPEGGVLQFREFKNMFCLRHPEPTTRDTNAPCNNNQGKITQIGFQDGAQIYIIMEICYQQSSRNTFWSKYDLMQGIQGKATATPRPTWVDSGACLLANPNAYSKVKQQAAFSRILGAGKGGNYVKQSGEYYLARGHLTAMADFVYGSQQVATCDYINAAPQWQTMNNGNWAAIEARVRLMASTKGRDLQVFTGTHGVTKLEGKKLYLDGNIPVPAVFWKVVYVQGQHQAVLFISVNNPYLSSAQRDPRYDCQSTCSQLAWLTPTPLPRGFKVWAPLDQVKGFTVCCQVNNLPATHALRDVVNSLPGNIKTAGLLV